MSSILGLLVVFGAVLGGYAMSGGPFAILLQPNELLVIGGAALGTLIVAAPGRVRGRVLRTIKRSFQDSTPKREEYMDLLKLLYELFMMIRRDGILSLERQLDPEEKTSLLLKYPSFRRRHHAMAFLTESLRQMVDGCSQSDLAQLFDSDLDTHHDEAHQPVSLLRVTGDSLPGLGIVAAVLGIIITMSHLDGGPEEIGHHVAAALVGTFLGILLCYGLVGPLATSVEMQDSAEHRYLLCIKEGVLAAARGTHPPLSIEFARRALFLDERPSFDEMQKAFESLKR